MSALIIQCPGDTVQTGTGKVDPARKFKCTMAARGLQRTVGTYNAQFTSTCSAGLKCFGARFYNKVGYLLSVSSNVRKMSYPKIDK